MKTIKYSKYGGPEVLYVSKVAKPDPNSDELLIKVEAASITTADSMMRRGVPKFARLFLGLRSPKNQRIGTGFSGTVEATGKNVQMFKKGERVFGETGLAFGANSEYVCLPEKGLVASMSFNMTFAEAAVLCDGFLTSLHFLTNVVSLKPGQQILINGAGGSLGMAAVQIARQMGAEVTAVCSLEKMEEVKALGADQVIDYHEMDFTTDGTTYDVVYDTPGKLSFFKVRKVLKKEGRFISPVLQGRLLFAVIWTSIFGAKKAKFSATGMQPGPVLQTLLEKLKTMVEKGSLKVTINRQYSMEQIVEAHQYLDEGHKMGNIVLAGMAN